MRHNELGLLNPRYLRLANYLGKRYSATLGLGKKQRHALEFIRSVNGWHTYAPDARRVVESLQRRGLVEIKRDVPQLPHGKMLHNMFRAVRTT